MPLRCKGTVFLVMTTSGQDQHTYKYSAEFPHIVKALAICGSVNGGDAFLGDALGNLVWRLSLPKTFSTTKIRESRLQVIFGH